MKSICVFCGSSLGQRAEYVGTAQELGRALAREEITLIYGGGNLGLMGAVADACMENGGQVIGVIPRALLDREHGHHGLTRLEVVESMHQRKARMAELADGFIALPGGFGTLEELVEMLTWAQLGIHEKPVAIVDTLGFFSPLVDMFDQAEREGFLRKTHRGLLIRSATPKSALDSLKSFRKGGTEQSRMTRPEA
jgi:uncharacterized protein (TIGR00730 family)